MYPNKVVLIIYVTSAIIHINIILMLTYREKTNSTFTKQINELHKLVIQQAYQEKTLIQ